MRLKMKLETDYGDVQLLLETIKDRAEDIVWFVDEALKNNTIDKEVMNTEFVKSEIVTTAFTALEIHFKMKEQENGTETN